MKDKLDGVDSDITLTDIEQAAERIGGHIRRTPCIQARFLHEPLRPGKTMLKLECLQVTGAFKVRGALNAVLQLSDDDRARGIVTASGGNHGLAIAYTGHVTDSPAVIYLPKNAPTDKATRARAWGAEVVTVGEVWDDAEAAALERAARDGLTYVHPFADPHVIAGQGTIAREMLKQSPEIDTIVCGIGGGGLVSGVLLAAKSIKPDIRVIGVEPKGAPTLFNSFTASALVTLDRIDTEANTLAPRRSAPLNFDIISGLIDAIVLVTDDEMREAAKWLWFETGQAVELAGAAAIAAIRTGKAEAAGDQCVAAIVCGNGTAALA